MWNNEFLQKKTETAMKCEFSFAYSVTGIPVRFKYRIKFVGLARSDDCPHFLSNRQFRAEQQKLKMRDMSKCQNPNGCHKASKHILSTCRHCYCDDCYRALRREMYFTNTWVVCSMQCFHRSPENLAEKETHQNDTDCSHQSQSGNTQNVQGVRGHIGEAVSQHRQAPEPEPNRTAGSQTTMLSGFPRDIACQSWRGCTNTPEYCMPTCEHSFCASCYLQLAKDTDAFRCDAQSCRKIIQAHAVQRRPQWGNREERSPEERAECNESKHTTAQNVQISASERDAFFTTNTRGKSLVENNQLEANGNKQRETENGNRKTSNIKESTSETTCQYFKGCNNISKYLLPVCQHSFCGTCFERLPRGRDLVWCRELKCDQHIALLEVINKSDPDGGKTSNWNFNPQNNVDTEKEPRHKSVVVDCSGDAKCEKCHGEPRYVLSECGHTYCYTCYRTLDVSDKYENHGIIRVAKCGNMRCSKASPLMNIRELHGSGGQYNIEKNLSQSNSADTERTPPEPMEISGAYGGNKKINEPRRPTEILHIKGLPANGMSCYFNSVLQVLAQTPWLIDALRGCKQTTAPVTKILLDILNDINSRDETKLYDTVKEEKVDELRKLISQRDESFTKGQQNDCHSFLVCLLNAIKEEIPENPVAIFEGTMKNVFTYSTCDHREESEPQMFSSLLLPLEHDKFSVDDGLMSLQQKQEYENSSIPCSECSVAGKNYKDTVTTSRMVIDKIPKILVLQIARFKEQSGTQGYKWLEKINNRVYYDDQVEITDLCYMPVKGDRKMDKDVHIHSLFGVISHQGSLYDGHYIAYVKKDPRMKSRASQWYQCASEEIQLCETKTFPASRNAYLLFYEYCDFK
ncbi:hypothetical protein ScPMuIL_012455 [Solemya velum]